MRIAVWVFGDGGAMRCAARERMHRQKRRGAEPVTLPRGGEARIGVVDASGRPLEGATVRALDSSGNDAAVACRGTVTKKRFMKTCP